MTDQVQALIIPLLQRSYNISDNQQNRSPFIDVFGTLEVYQRQ